MFANGIKRILAVVAVISSLVLAQSGSLAVASDPGSGSELNFGNNDNWKIMKSGQAAVGKKEDAGNVRLSRPRTEKWIPVNPALLKSPGHGQASGQVNEGVSSISEDPSGSLLSDDRSGSGEAYKTAVELDLEAKKLVDSGDYTRAHELLERAVKTCPGEGRFWFNKGLTAERLSKWSEARGDFDKAGSLKPALSAKSLLELARICSKTGETSKAAEMLWDLKGKIRFDPTFERKVDGLLIELADKRAASIAGIVAGASDRQLYKGSLRAELSGQIGTAVTLARAYELRNPGKADAQLRLASSQYKAGNYSEALSGFKSAAELDSSDPAALLGILSCCDRLGMLEDIQKTRQDFLDRFPNHPKIKTFQEQNNYYQKDFSKIRARESQSTQRLRESGWFSKNLMPLKVYAADFAHSTEGWSPSPDQSVDCPAILQKALADWTTGTNGKVSFQTTSNLDEANIEVEWVDDSTKMAHNFAVGTTSITTNARGMPRCRIQLLVPTRRAANSAQRFYGTTLHELGHSLGLSHSSDPNDIMYITSAYSSSRLSDNDLRRINELYK